MKSSKSIARRAAARREQQRRRSIGKLFSSVVIFLSLLGFACQGGEEKQIEINAKASTPEKKIDDFQEILKSFQTANFNFIFAFRRPDGEALSSDDKKFLKEYSPVETNRWNLTDDGKIAVAGSNYKFPPESLEILRLRFTVEDYSKPGGDGKVSSVNQNSNVNQNSKNAR